MRILILYSRSNTLRPRSVIASLATDKKKEGHDVSVLDISAYSYVNQDLPPKWFARLFGEDVYPDSLNRILKDHQIPFIELNPCQVVRELPPEVSKEFDASVYSELVTYFRTNTPSSTNLFTRFTERKIREKSRSIYHSLGEFLERSQFDKVIVPNGRISTTRLSISACEDAGVAVEYFEIGRALENSYYSGEQQIHDREGTQSEVESVTSHLSPSQIRNTAKAWLSTRMTTGLAIHPYNTNWSDELDEIYARLPKPLAVFFTSSVDEFTSYGGSWQTHEWADQYEAFSSIIDLLDNRGITCVLRIHPNLQNKSLDFVRRELDRVRDLMSAHPKLQVITHTDSTSSYDLLKIAEYVVVGRSTLGLEGSCLGKCVWTTTAARYDSIADIRQVLRPSDVTVAKFRKWKVNPFGAQRFVNYWVEQDSVFAFGEENWSTWDSLKPPRLMKIGNLLVKNSLWHKVHLVMLEITKAVNRHRGRKLLRNREPSDRSWMRGRTQKNIEE